jgi:hypothetical protein
MEEQSNVKWIVVISFILFFVITAYGPTIFLGPYYQYQYPLPRDVWYYLNRLETLLFLATVATGALFVAGFGKKELVYRLSVYFFIISMGLFFLSLLRTLFI